ncbi:hypothetical protein AB0L06_36165 [Spirillospora sp. NPDC052269]
MGHSEWWEDIFRRLPPEVLDDYLRTLRAVHRYYEGRIIGSPGVRSSWVSIDDGGRLRVGPPVGSVHTYNPYPEERAGPSQAEVALRDLMASYPDCRCGAYVCGDIVFKFWWPGRRRIEDTSVDVHLGHRQLPRDAPPCARHGFFRFPFEVEGRLVRRMRMDPATVEFIDRQR